MPMLNHNSRSFPLWKYPNLNIERVRIHNLIWFYIYHFEPWENFQRILDASSATQKWVVTKTKMCNVYVWF